MNTRRVITSRFRPVQIILLIVCGVVAGLAPRADRTTEMFVGSLVVGALCVVWIFETSALSQQD